MPNWYIVYFFLIPGSQTDDGGKFQPHYPGAILTVSVKVLLSFLRGCLHEKTHTGLSFIPGWFFLSYHVYIMTGSFHISLFEGTLHVDEIHISKHYACAAHSSLPADRFHSETCGHFAFMWYLCGISYQSEILTPVQQSGWTHARVTHAGMTFCGGIM